MEEFKNQGEIYFSVEQTAEERKNSERIKCFGCVFKKHQICRVPAG